MPISVVCDACGSKYALKDEFAGRKVKCKTCGAVLLVAAGDDPSEPRPDRGYHGAFDRDRFLLNQKKLALDERYYVYGEEDQERPILYVVRPRKYLKHIGAFLAGIFCFFLVFVPLMGIGLALGKDSQAIAGVLMIAGMVLGIVATVAVIIALSPKRHIYFYRDEAEGDPLLEVLQDRKFNVIIATYTVRDPASGELGRMTKNYLYNLFRKKWVVTAPDGSTLAVAREDSLILSLLRRFFGPMLGFLRTNFIILPPGSDAVIGEFNRKMTLFDRYVLDMTADRDHRLDRRMAIALGVLLDTGERR